MVCVVCVWCVCGWSHSHIVHLHCTMDCQKLKLHFLFHQPPPVIEYEQPLRRGGEGRQGTQSMYVRAPQHPPSDPRAARMDQSFGRDPPRHHESPSDVFSSFPRAEHPSPDVRHRATMPPQYWWECWWQIKKLYCCSPITRD